MQINDEIINKKLFSSEDKYSMVQTKDYYFYKGACEVLLEKCQKYLSLSGNEEIFISKSFIQSMVNSYTSKGYRVLVNAYGKNKDDLVFINIIVIADTLRPEAKPSLDLIKNAGIKTIMITGDAKETAVSIGKELGLYNDKSIALTHNELSVLTDEQIINLYPNLCIIARALPQDKSRLVSILQSYKLVVGMTGDGVNDCLALKESDCSIAMASGADAAKNVSQFVLLDSKIDNLPLILKEGRRSINNIERSSSLLLSKTIFTIILIIACIFLNTEYFFIPIHLTLITFFTIGVPSFILALEPNHELVKGNFLLKVFLKALPSALTVVFNVVIIKLFQINFGLSQELCSTLTVFLTAITGFIFLNYICKPYNLLRGVMMCILFLAFEYCALYQYAFFNISNINKDTILVFIVLFICSMYIFDKLKSLSNYILRKTNNI